MTEPAAVGSPPPGPVTDPAPDPLGTIARHLAPSPPDDRRFARRRLACLAGVLALVLAVAPFVSGGGADAVGVRTEAAAPGGTVRAAALGTPTGVRELLSQTTTTLVEATGATTSTTAPALEAGTTSVVPPTAEVAADAPEPTTTTEDPPARALHVDDAGDEEAATSEPAQPTTTTTAPRRAPSTTTPPTTAAPTTTTAPEPEPEPQPADDGGYAYDDPRSTQVWYDLARCESGGNWSIDTGNGYYGGLQFSLPTWESVGGTGYPHEHPAATQIEHGRRLQARQGWGAWPHCSEKLGLR